jgi:hypothetical protein
MSTLTNVNNSDIRSAIELGCRTMASVFNADDNEIPFFGSEVLPNPRLGFSSVHSESHVPGRHLNALLSAEAIAGVSIDEEAVRKHTAATFFSYSGVAPLPLNRDELGGPLINFNEHNLREGFHALYALVRYRGSERAAEIAEASIAFVFDLWNPQSGWDRQKLESEFDLRVAQDHTFITGIARAIGPLVKYFRATGHGPALELALTLASMATSEYFLPDGAYNREKFGQHTHSTTCVMSSLAQLADLTADSALLGRVRAFYDNGLWDIRDGLGWVIENSNDDSPPDRGECNNTGDIVETALILGRRGYPEYFQDAERIIRGHLLPAQLRDNSFILDPPNPSSEDGLREVAERHVGAFGFPAPYGHRPLGLERVSFNMDIVGGAVASLCEVLREAAMTTAHGHAVNLMFDHLSESLRVEANSDGAGVTAIPLKPGPLRIRLPLWVDQSELKVESSTRHRVLDSYVLIAEPCVGEAVKVSYPLADSELVLHHRTRDIRARLRGDTVVSMDDFGAELTFFPPIDL